MIRFQGQLSQDCKKWFLAREYKDSVIANIIISLLLSAIIVIVGVLWNLIALAFLAIPATILVLSFFPSFYKKIVNKVPNVIEIDEKSIYGNIENDFISKSLDTVKCVIDVGEWYVFNFFFPHKNRYFVCQKDLIVEGSLDDFEKLFEEKIVRKV